MNFSRVGCAAGSSWTCPVSDTMDTLSTDEVADLDGLAERAGIRGDRYNPEHLAFLDR